MGQAIIFMTGCIDPRGMGLTVLSDKEERRKQYLDAIRFYLSASGVPVLFVENSGTDISENFKHEIAAGKLEIVTFSGNDYDKAKGKGYGEMLIVEEAIRASKLFGNAEFIFKVSGRYKVLNVRSYIAFQHAHNDDIDIMVNLQPGLSLADSRFFGARPFLYIDYLVKYRESIDDRKFVYFETILANAVHQAIVNGHRYSGLHHYPRHSAQSGTSGDKYNDDWSRWILKETLLKMMHRLQKAFEMVT
ncbi:hypothetical protein [Chlorobium sp.]|uniref:hypothetical protein n=1 Tax=Chlorobium sp. TaxID=1095 RepID=UPI0025B7F6A1|nr:hypothetical protein [Chlorobium sp.]MCF8271891.1 hypothetical protein [Chlorobium sp.]MCF8291884.1 hypothetical protein [Chlorobium sp.]MCF8385980.1 hypothetical protein [Chlorobium sp.]